MRLKVLDLMDFKVTFPNVHLQSSSLQSGQDKLHILSMLLQYLTVDWNIIYVSSAKDVQDIKIQDIIDVFYFILFYSYTDLAIEPCRTSRYRLC